jgi:hypothetical protein
MCVRFKAPEIGKLIAVDRSLMDSERIEGGDKDGENEEYCFH